MSDAARILFPSDAPAGQQRAPDWFAAQQAGATARLMGSGKAAGDDLAASLFPNEAKAGGEKLPADASGDPAKALFPTDGDHFEDRQARGFFNSFAVSASGDGDSARAEAIRSAGDALIADAKSAGTDARELASALDIVRERQGDTIAEITPEKLEADFASSMATLEVEFGDSLASDLAAARAFILDLDKLAPGTIDTLNRTGAGNDPRLIRKAIAEAKRRGYGR